MTDFSNSHYETLKNHISATGFKEAECRESLKHVKFILAEETVLEFYNFEEEWRGYFGDSDLIISCKVCDTSNTESIKAYIWELKAPQCHIFEVDTNNRLLPSKYLIRAENQLLYYFHESQINPEFLDYFNITHPDNVVFGGIIIGCTKNKIKGNIQNSDKKFEKALAIRKKYFYNPNNITFVTWDFILDQIKKIPTPEKYKPGLVEIEPTEYSVPSILTGSSSI